MAKLGPHNRLIVREADAALKPLGLQQKGRLRSWRLWVLGNHRRISVPQMGPGDLYQCGGVLAVPSEGA